MRSKRIVAVVIVTCSVALTTTLIGLITNAISSQRSWPGPLHLIQHHAWLSLVTATLIGAILATALTWLSSNGFDNDKRALGETEVRESRADPVVLRSLPRDINNFVNREAELTRLVDLVNQSLRQDDLIPVQVIDGMAGVGKTTFAVRAAHLLKSEFPDGQLFVNLSGYTSGIAPIAAVDTLASLLAASGMEPQEIPTGIDEFALLQTRSAVWRDRLTDKKVILVLDNAVRYSQIEPLLPSHGGCLVIVTSRRRLAAQGDIVTQVRALTPDDAVELFGRLSSRRPEELDRESVELVVRLAGYLPLAISLLTARLRNHPSWSMDDLKSRLITAHNRLGEIRSGDREIAAAFDLSYQDLPVDRRKFFMRLGAFPGLTIDEYVAAALTSCSLENARHELEILYEDNLIEETAVASYQMHDLVRDYAQTLTDETEGERSDAIERLVGYYLKSMMLANDWLCRPGEVLFAPQRGFVFPASLVAIPALESRNSAIAWLSKEKANILALIEYSHSAERYSDAIRLTAALAPFLRYSGPWDQAVALHRLASQRARRITDPAFAANSLADLGIACRLLADCKSAITFLTESLSVYKAENDLGGQGKAYNQLGIAQYLVSDYGSSEQSQLRALEICDDIDYKLGVANALADLGMVQRKTSRFAESAIQQTKALVIYRELGDAYGEANALRDLGFVYMVTGNYSKALDHHQGALEIYRRLEDRIHQAYALNGVGAVRKTIGNIEDARSAHLQALELFTEVGDRHGQATSMLFLGAIQRITGELDSARASFDDALAIYADLGVKEGIAQAMNELGMLYMADNETSESLSTLKAALVIFKELKDHLDEAIALNNLGEIQTLHEPDAALPYFQDALQVSRQIEFPTEEARAIWGIARWQKRAGRQDEANHSLRAALDIYTRLGLQGNISAITQEIESLRS